MVAAGTTQALADRKCYLVFLFLLLTKVQVCFAKILIVGDSMGEFECSTVAEFCSGQEVVNEAVAGSTAYQWGDGGQYSFLDAFNAAGTGVTHIWISIGGNDYLSPQEDPGAAGASSGSCSISRSDLLTRFRPLVANALSARAASNNAGAKFVFTGYCIPRSPGPCPEGSTFDVGVLKSVYETIVAENPGDFDCRSILISSLVFVTKIHQLCAHPFADIDMWYRCGAIGNAPNSDPEFFMDVIHLNRRGYCHFFSYDKMQTAFGCTLATHDCCMQPQTTCKDADYNGNFPCNIAAPTPSPSPSSSSPDGTSPGNPSPSPSSVNQSPSPTALYPAPSPKQTKDGRIGGIFTIGSVSNIVLISATTTVFIGSLLLLISGVCQREADESIAEPKKWQEVEGENGQKYCESKKEERWGEGRSLC